MAVTPTLVASTAIVGAIARSTVETGSSTPTLIVAIIGAVGVIGAAIVTVVFQRRSDSKGDPLAASMYRDLRRDLSQTKSELTRAEQRIDALEELLRAHSIEVPHATS